MDAEPEPVHFARSRSRNRWNILLGAGTGAGIVSQSRSRSRSRPKIVRFRNPAPLHKYLQVINWSAVGQWLAMTPRVSSSTCRRGVMPLLDTCTGLQMAASAVRFDGSAHGAARCVGPARQSAGACRQLWTTVYRRPGGPDGSINRCSTAHGAGPGCWLGHA